MRFHGMASIVSIVSDIRVVEICDLFRYRAPVDLGLIQRRVDGVRRHDGGVPDLWSSIIGSDVREIREEYTVASRRTPLSQKMSELRNIRRKVEHRAPRYSFLAGHLRDRRFGASGAPVLLGMMCRLRAFEGVAFAGFTHELLHFLHISSITRVSLSHHHL